MSRIRRLGVLGLLMSGRAWAAEPLLPPELREPVVRVCGFCHFPDFFDETTGDLVEEKFLAKRELILDRLQRPVGTAGRMPPKRSSVMLSDEERQGLVDFLKALPSGEAL